MVSLATSRSIIDLTPDWRAVAKNWSLCRHTAQATPVNRLQMSLKICQKYSVDIYIAHFLIPNDIHQTESFFVIRHLRKK